MSYASVAAHNAPPPSMQPKPDPGLLNTEAPEDKTGIVDDMEKVSVVNASFLKNPKTVTGETEIATGTYVDESRPIDTSPPSAGTGVAKDTDGKKKARVFKEKAKHELDRAEAEGEHLWDLAKEQLLRPGVAGGLVGLVNVGLLTATSYTLYFHPHLRTNPRFLTTTAISAIALFSAESYGAHRYTSTPRGRAEKQRAKREGAAVYRHTREVVLRPGVLGGIVGVVNLGVLGTVGWFAYQNWDAPRWDRRIVSAVSVGLFTLWGGEGVLAERYRENQL